jgi:hypothetical protein
MCKDGCDVRLAHSQVRLPYRIARIAEGETLGNGKRVFKYLDDRGAWRMCNTSSLLSEPVRPLAQTNGQDSPRLVDELVPCLAAVVDEIVVGF